MPLDDGQFFPSAHGGILCHFKGGSLLRKRIRRPSHLLGKLLNLQFGSTTMVLGLLQPQNGNGRVLGFFTLRTRLGNDAAPSTRMPLSQSRLVSFGPCTGFRQL